MNLKGLKVKKSAEQGLVDFLRYLLEQKRVSAVFTLRQTANGLNYDYALMTDPAMLDHARPLHPVMPVNAGQELAVFTPMKEPIAVVAKPCELRAFIELVKRYQGLTDHFLLISHTCGGAFPFQSAINGALDKKLSAYWGKVREGENPEEVRPVCRACKYFTPLTADITLALVGEDVEKECVIYFQTEKGETMAQGFEGALASGNLETQAVEKLRKQRLEVREKKFQKLDSEVKGLDGMIEMFGRCLGCHGCSRVCPICYCVLCDFESHLFDSETAMIEEDLERRGGIRLPTDTVLFHLGRLSHMSFSCVGCGMCTEVCPAGIQVADLFMRVGEETAGVFDYLPGRDVEEPVPVTVYKEKELSALGEE